ncbi:MAG: malectin domain-containing carbohydrate-binding protein [Syntrophobacteraceae bacterium]|jgi:hypothetical protein|nr:malectin domain-containing carbohydrate-binding protein [Syntrophobacteraceae bacterium]
MGSQIFRTLTRQRQVIIGVMILTSFAVPVPPSSALQLTLKWADGSNGMAKGYKLHYGTEKGNYTTVIDVGRRNSQSLTDLQDNQEYYFSVTAYDDKRESIHSSELQYIPQYNNTPPIAEDMSIVSSARPSVTGRLSASDRDFNVLRFHIVQPPSRGTLTELDTETGTFVYTPGPDSTGVDSFVFRASDGMAASNPATVRLSLSSSETLPPDFPPVSSPPPDASPPPELPTGAGERVVHAINAGGGEFVDPAGTTYTADAYYSGGSTSSTTKDIECAGDAVLYQTERFGDFAYNLPIENGFYILTLKFAEIYWEAAGTRVFDVWVEGQPIAQNLDLCESSGPLKPFDLQIPIAVEDGSLDISFASSRNHSKLSGILVRQSSENVLLAINAGGPNFTTSGGLVYGADSPCAGGATRSTPHAIQGTPDSALYQTERYGDFAYDIPIANGAYLVTLQFAETQWSHADQRVFDVWVEGEEIVSDLDLYAAAGEDVAFDFTHTAVVLDGRLNISFHSNRDHAQVCGVLIQAFN